MVFLVLLKDLHEVVGAVETLRSFIVNELRGFLTSVADSDYAAAARALEDSKISREPRREIESAITSLRNAFDKYSNQQRGLRDSQLAELHKKASQAAILISCCYKALGERELMTTWAKEAANSFWDYGFNMMCHKNGYDLFTLEVLKQRWGLVRTWNQVMKEIEQEEAVLKKVIQELNPSTEVEIHDWRKLPI